MHLSKRLPDPVKRAAAVSAAQDKFRQHWGAGDDEATRTGLKAEADSRLGFLKMMTPSALHRGASRSGGRWLYRDGEKVSTDEISKLPVSRPGSLRRRHRRDPHAHTQAPTQATPRFFPRPSL